MRNCLSIIEFTIIQNLAVVWCILSSSSKIKRGYFHKMTPLEIKLWLQIGKDLGSGRNNCNADHSQMPLWMHLKLQSPAAATSTSSSTSFCYWSIRKVQGSSNPKSPEIPNLSFICFQSPPIFCLQFHLPAFFSNWIFLGIISID